MNLKALNDHVIVKPLNREETTASGIIIPGQAQEKSRQGIIAAIGPGHIDYMGRFVPTELEVGMLVAYPMHGGNEVKVDDVSYLSLREGEILAVIAEDV